VVQVRGCREERADERLNAALGKALKMMQERVKEKGFRDSGLG